MPKITGIVPHSPAARTRAAPGDWLLSINGHAIGDVLDYRFYAAERRLRLALRRPQGRAYTIRLRKGEYDDIGLEFDDGLMDRQRHCKNKCIFCFVDQLPPGLRASLYFKDDDARLSFLFGNYITLTNLTDRDARRMIAMRLSPVHVSVHTMDPALRCRMMGNAKAGECLQYLNKFAKAGLELDVQLVLCPGWNDGEALRRSLQELLKLPTLRSVAAVPVGLTQFREGLTPLRPFGREAAAQVIACVNAFRRSRAELCCADEFFLLANQPMPGVEYYGEFRQLENGVGLWALLRQEFLNALAELSNSGLPAAPYHCAVATGEAAAPLLQFFVDEMAKVWHNKRVDICCVRNAFFGEHITVAGLLTAEDIVAQLRGRHLGQALLLPAAVFNLDGFTLDGKTREDISRALGVPVKAVKHDARALLEAMLGA
jgi:putative radical SAM enzyme (TIGR03279 family)